jgi:hypothetical protein
VAGLLCECQHFLCAIGINTGTGSIGSTTRLGPVRKRRIDYNIYDHDANYHVDLSGRRYGKFDESSRLLDE